MFGQTTQENHQDDVLYSDRGQFQHDEEGGQLILKGGQQRKQGGYEESKYTGAKAGDNRAQVISKQIKIVEQNVGYDTSATYQDHYTQQRYVRQDTASYLPPDWDFIIRPMDEGLHLIQRPQVVAAAGPGYSLKNYIVAPKYPFRQRWVIFLIAFALWTALLALLSVLAFNWGENSIWWCAIGCILFCLLFVCIIEGDKKRWDKKRVQEELQLNAQRGDQQHVHVESNLSEGERRYRLEVDERRRYVGVLNYIRQLSLSHFLERRPNDETDSFERTLADIRRRIDVPIGQRFLREDVYTLDTYRSANSHERLIIIKEIFAMYLLTQWALEGHSAYDKNDVDYRLTNDQLEVHRDLLHALRSLTGSDVVLSDILMLTDVRNRGLYNKKRIAKLLGDVRFVDNRERKSRNIRKRLVKVQQLYRILVETMRDDYIKYNVDFTNPGHMASLTKNKVYQGEQAYVQPNVQHQYEVRGRQDNDMAFDHHDRSANKRLSPSKHGKVYVQHPTGDKQGDINRSDISDRAVGQNIDYGIRR